MLDSRHLSGSLGLIVLRTARAIEQGLDHEQIVERARDWIAGVRIFVSVKTLAYMVRGGRVSPMKGLLARLLHLKPIVSVDGEGNSILLAKAFSQRGNVRQVLRRVAEIAGRERLWKTAVLHAHDAPAAADYARRLERATGRKPAFIMDISPVVGLNAGLGAVAVALMRE